MSLRSGDGGGDDWRHINRQGARGDFHKGEIVSARDAIENRRSRQIIGGGGGWNFGNPIELPSSPYPAYAAQTVIHLQPTHAIVTTGIVDAANPMGPVVKSSAGLWVSRKAVPAQKTVSGTPVWNLPQLPLPNPDNYDDPLNFWIFLGNQLCF